MPNCWPIWCAPIDHRPIAGDSADAEAIKVLARAHQSLIRARTRHANMLRATLLQYYPRPWRPLPISMAATRWRSWVVHRHPSRAPG
jgi:Transposase